MNYHISCDSSLRLRVRFAIRFNRKVHKGELQRKHKQSLMYETKSRRSTNAGTRA